MQVSPALELHHSAVFNRASLLVLWVLVAGVSPASEIVCQAVAQLSTFEYDDGTLLVFEVRGLLTNTRA